MTQTLFHKPASTPPVKTFRIGFGNGADALFQQFDFTLLHNSCKANLTILNEGCQGSISSYRRHCTFAVFGEQLYEGAFQELILTAEPDPSVRYFRIRRKRPNGILHLHIRYNPDFACTRWEKSFCGTLIDMIAREYLLKHEPNRSVSSRHNNRPYSHLWDW